MRKRSRKVTAHESSQISENKGKRNVISKANTKLTFVPLVFLLCRMWGTIRFLMGAHFSDALNGGNSTWLVVLQVSMTQTMYRNMSKTLKILALFSYVPNIT